jgi:hypothetical protein
MKASDERSSMKTARQFADEIRQAFASHGAPALQATLEAAFREALGYAAVKAARERWTACQNRLAEYEALASKITGIEQSLPNNIEHLAAEIIRLRQWIADLQSGMFINCVYCGHRYGPDPGTPTAMADVLKAHGVRRWDEPTGVVTSQRAPGQGAFSVADPRTGHEHHQNVYRVTRFDDPSHTVTGASHTAGGAPSVADPRPTGPLFGKYKVSDWDEPAGTVIGGDDSGAYAVADPRAPGAFSGKGKYKVTKFDSPSGVVIAESGTGNGGFAVADPRIMSREKGDHYLTGGHYGVVPWNQPTGAVSAAACHDNGPWSVADPRMPNPTDKMVAIIRALDGTCHRPFTTLELAALQSLVDPDNLLELDGDSDSAKRERIGNAVPPDAAQAIADLMAQTLLLSKAGESFILSASPIWVRPIAVALSVNIPREQVRALSPPGNSKRRSALPGWSPFFVS